MGSGGVWGLFPSAPEGGRPAGAMWRSGGAPRGRRRPQRPSPGALRGRVAGAETPGAGARDLQVDVPMRREFFSGRARGKNAGVEVLSLAGG